MAIVANRAFRAPAIFPQSADDMVDQLYSQLENLNRPIGELEAQERLLLDLISSPFFSGEGLLEIISRYRKVVAELKEWSQKAEALQEQIHQLQPYTRNRHRLL